MSISKKQQFVNFIHNQLNLLVIPTIDKKAINKWNELDFDKKTNFINVMNDNLSTYAIITGRRSGITVIDIDCIKPNQLNGRDVLLEFKKNNDIGHPFIIETPNNGLHLYYKYNEKLTKSSSKIKNYKNEIIPWDLRSDNGYVIGPHSIINNIEYKNFNIDLPTYIKTHNGFQNVPDCFIKLFDPNTSYILNDKYQPIQTIKPIAQLNIKTDNKSECKSDMKSEITFERVNELVSQLSIGRSDNRDSWLRVIWSIVNAGLQLGKDFSKIIHEFSKKIR